jgi:hypothetical protein
VSIAAIPLLQVKPGESTILFANYNNTPERFTWYRNNNLSAVTNTGVLPGINIDSLGVYKVIYKDASGCTVTSNELTISAGPADKLWMYPNPSDGRFQVRFYSGATGVTRVVNLYNGKGERIEQRTVLVNGPYQRVDIDISRFSAGMYYVELLDTSGKRLAKEKVLLIR